MAAIDTTGLLGAVGAVRLTDDELANLNTLDRAFSDMGSASSPLAVAKGVRHAGGAIQTTTLVIHKQIASGGTANSFKWKAPFPLEVLEVQFGCEAAGGSAATATLRKNGTAMIAAAADILAGLTTTVRKYPETTAYQVAFDDALDLYATSTGGTADGVSCVITWRRQ